jgi:hypothetical protein
MIPASMARPLLNRKPDPKNMNKSQQIFVDAATAATALAGNLSPHELTTRTLAEFKTQGHDAEDFDDWQRVFTSTRSQVRRDANDRANELARRATQKTQSELKAEAAAKSASPPK